MLEGTVFAEFADVRRSCALLGIDPDEKEVWQIATALGVHRPAAEQPDDPFGPTSARDPDVADLKRAALAARAGRTPEWANRPEDDARLADLIELRRPPDA